MFVSRSRKAEPQTAVAARQHGRSAGSEGASFLPIDVTSSSVLSEAVESVRLFRIGVRFFFVSEPCVDRGEIFAARAEEGVFRRDELLQGGVSD